MNDWIDDDEDDFLSAGFGGSAETSEPDAGDSAAAEADEFAMDDEAWSPAAGFPDGTNAVRLWADEDGNLTKVRVSLSWKEKLRESSLEVAFSSAFTYLNGWYQLGKRTEDAIYSNIPDSTSKQTLSREALARHIKAFNELSDRISELSGPNTVTKGETTSASDFDGAVTVKLDANGRAFQVLFDQEWLDEEANSAGISRAVTNCYRWAKAKWRPPVEELTERGELVREQLLLSKELDAMLANGVQIRPGS